jgi:hypothetical protein
VKLEYIPCNNCSALCHWPWDFLFCYSESFFSTRAHSWTTHGHDQAQCHQWDILTNCTVNKKINKNATLEVETCLSTSRITFYFFKPFQDSPQPIQLQYVLWIYSEEVVAELTRVVYDRNQQVESRVIWGCWLESSHISYSTRVES